MYIEYPYVCWSRNVGIPGYRRRVARHGLRIHVQFAGSRALHLLFNAGGIGDIPGTINSPSSQGDMDVAVIDIQIVLSQQVIVLHIEKRIYT
jgi:hypothetical protein